MGTFRVWASIHFFIAHSRGIISLGIALASQLTLSDFLSEIWTLRDNAVRLGDKIKLGDATEPSLDWVTNPLGSRLVKQRVVIMVNLTLRDGRFPAWFFREQTIACTKFNTFGVIYIYTWTSIFRRQRELPRSLLGALVSAWLNLTRMRTNWCHFLHE